MIDSIRKHLPEAAAALWMVLVSVRYVTSYFTGGPNPDLSRAYLAMLALAVVVLIRDLLRGRSDASRRSDEPGLRRKS